MLYCIASPISDRLCEYTIDVFLEEPMKPTGKLSAKTAAMAIAATASLCLSAQSPAIIEGKDSTLKIGFFAQPTFEAIGGSPLEGTSQNLFFRRMRFMFSGNLGTNFEYFIATDNVNLGKDLGNGNKNNEGFRIADMVLTYKIAEKIKLDAGMLIVPLSHVSTQAATNLQTWDFPSYAFVHGGPMGNGINRDGGVQLRGIVGKAQGNLEFRVGAYQGKRLPISPERVSSNNSLRLAGRAQWNFFDADGGVFLSGTTLGAKKLLSVGFGYDKQDNYSATAIDVFMDLPIGSNGVMGQWNHVEFDGGDWLPGLPKQTTDFAEFGYRFGQYKLSPMVRFESKKMDTPTEDKPDETRMGVGLGWWLKGHQNNLKLFYTRVSPKNVSGSTLHKAYDHIALQWQVLYW
jgi:hypothetical protein